MDNVIKNKLKKSLGTYFKEIHKIYTGGGFREESFYPALKRLFECRGEQQFAPTKANVLVLPKKTEVGIPDFRVGKNGKIVGYIEAKTPDTSLREVENSEQLKRYRESLPNLILTNFLEFRLYRQFKEKNHLISRLISKVEVGRQHTLLNLSLPPIPEKLDSFYELLEKFFSFSVPEIRKSSALAVELANRTRFLECILQEELSRENEEVTRFYKAFQEELIEGLTKERFADLYAQTITYGLFAAGMKVQNTLKRETAWEFIPENIPLLKEIFYSMTGPHFPESLIWIVDDIIQVLWKADIGSILKEFKTTRWEEDPVIHFYETFLAIYNPEERERLGVYYTPLPVVSYIVRSIHKLLKEKFGKAEGLATRDVTLLDPAAGTLTFVVQAIKQVQKELKERNKEGLIKPYIEEHILPHFHAFEILVSPYTVGHFKVSMVLEEMGYKFKEGERFKFYLTNTLQMKEPKQISFLIDLAKEGWEAKKIKEKVPILVVLGNPPYSVSSENKSIFIEGGRVPDNTSKKGKIGKVLKYRYVPGLMDDYKEDVRDERNIQPLSDDYIKFIRFAHWKIEQAGKGILGFITNNSYLSGVIHRGMRKKLLETFNEIYILNLHGSSRIGEKTPEGGKDENVFDIQQGVTIALYAKLEEPQKDKKVYYADLWGLREKDKYPYLLNNDVKTSKWQKLKPIAPYYFFVPKDFALQEEYEKFWKVSEIFKEWSFGITTSRDYFVVGFTKKGIQQKIRIFTGDLPDELVKEGLKLKDTGTWKLSEARQKIKGQRPEDKIYPYAYRPFDIRWICYEPAFIERDRYNVMKHMLMGENKGIALTRGVRDPIPWSHVHSSCSITDKNIIAIKDNSYFFPLYLYKQKESERRSSRSKVMMLFEPGADYETKEPNLSPAFIKALIDCCKKELSPEEIFYYIYAILYSPTYRKKYEEFLKIDFPRIPLLSNYGVFKELSKLGKELVGLHLLKSSALDETGIGFPVGGSDTVEKVFYDQENQSVFINKGQYFEGISKEVWEYRIGAYQVLQKYLKDRKKRRLSLDEINHYMKVAKSIQLTIELQEKIDKVYKKNKKRI